MARLLKIPAKGHWDFTTYGRWRNGSSLPPCSCNYSEECRSRCKADLDAIGAGNVMSFNVADGFAMYEVVREQPLTLRHIPEGDAYEAHPALLRGLQYSDLVQQRKWNEMFEKVRNTVPRNRDGQD